jgi:hypothetical protein
MTIAIFWCPDKYCQPTALIRAANGDKGKREKFLKAGFSGIPKGVHSAQYGPTVPGQ